MRVFDHRPRSRRPLAWLLLAFVVAVLAAGGFGFLERGFLQRLKAHPAETLVQRPLRMLRAQREAVDLPVLRVDMKFKHFEQILAKRQEALERGILQARDSDMVPAEIELDGRRVRVKMRLKGDWPDHFKTEKWSYRVHVRDGEQLFGMRRFSLQHPASRRFLSEWAFLESLRRDGVLAPRYRFVRVVFNGDDKGIFALEEHFAKELLESQGRREGPILKLDEGPLWEGRARALDRGVLDFTVFDQLDYRSAEVDFFGENRLRADSLLWDQARAARRRLESFQRGELPASEVFDLEKMPRFLALCRLWGANHALIWHNLRFYYDPVSTRLEPIAFDAEPIDWTREEMWATDLMGGYEIVAGHSGWYPWIDDALADARFRRRYLEELYRVSGARYLADFEGSVENELEQNRKALRSEWLDLADPLDALRRGQAYLAGRFNPARSLLATASAEAGSSAVALLLSNVAQLPVVLDAVRTPEGEELWSGELELAGRPRAAAPVRTPLSLPLRSTVVPDSLVLEWRVGGCAPRQQGGVELRPPPMDSVRIVTDEVSPEEIASAHPYLLRSAAREWTVPAGSYEIHSDLFLPEGWTLRIEAGAQLRFAEDCVLVCRGPLLAEGEPDAPIHLEALGDGWPGLLVLDAGGGSRLVEVEIRGTRGVTRPGWTLLGGVNVQNSPVLLERCRFLGNRAEDALNLIRCVFEMRDCSFEDTHSDAFDGDFVQGTLARAVFNRIGGDAIDFSGSEVLVEGMRALEIGDKAVSAGEGSSLEIHDLEVRSASIGIASKDLSSVVLRGGRIESAGIGLAAYTKKPVFGPGFLEARELEMRDVEREVLVQSGSEVRWNLEVFEGSELDVKELYARGILGNQP